MRGVERRAAERSFLQGLALFAAACACAGLGCWSNSSASSDAGVESATAIGPSSVNAIELSVVQYDPMALAQILSHVPSALPPTTSSGTLVGTPSIASSAELRKGKPSPLRVSLGREIKPSSAGLEKDLRAGVYFALVDQCRDDAGEILPPESVLVEFRITSEGSVDRASVRTSATAAEYENAARCMARVLRGSDLRLAPARVESDTVVQSLVPSVD